MKVVVAVRPVASVTITVLAPAAIVGTVNAAVPAAKLETKLEDSGVMRKPPRVTLKVALGVNPKPVKVTTVPDGPLLGVANTAVIAIAKVDVAFRPNASVALKKYGAVGRLGTVTTALKLPEVSGRPTVPTMNVPAAVDPKRIDTVTPAICANPVPVTVTDPPGDCDVGDTIIFVSAVTLKPPVAPEVEPEIVPSDAVIV